MLRTSAPLIGALGSIAMPSLALFRRIAIAALLIAFVLPLTKCTSTSKDGVTTVDYQYPFEHVVDGIKAITANETHDLDSIILGAATIAIFFIPAAIAGVRARIQSIIYISLAAPAEWLLYEWTTIGTPQAGGIIAMSCWAVLFIVSALTLRAKDAT